MIGTQIHPTADIADGVMLPSQVLIEADVKIGTGVFLIEDPSKVTILRHGVCIAPKSVVGAGVEIGHGARVEPGCVVLTNVPPNAVVRGNPAQIVGYVSGSTNLPADQKFQIDKVEQRLQTEKKELPTEGCAFYLMAKISDLRGNLTVGEYVQDFPFIPERYFIVFEVPTAEWRGEHAHRECQQILICVRGSCCALVDDGSTRSEVILDDPTVGLYMPPMIWGTQYRYSPDAALLVFASHSYDPDDYIRDYGTFLSELNKK